MKRAVALAFMALAFPVAAADPDVCALVPVADVESALHVKVMRTVPGPGECIWSTGVHTVSGKAQVTLAAKGASVRNNDAVDLMKSRGWMVAVADDTPSLWCARVVAPLGPSTALTYAECIAIAKGHQVHVWAHGPAMTAAHSKRLVEKIAIRMTGRPGGGNE